MTATLSRAPQSYTPPVWVSDAAGLRPPESFLHMAEVNHGGISQMLWSERVLLYSSVFGLRPKRCLEIGTFRGGSARTIVAALDDIGEGKLICVDPRPQVNAETWAKIEHRATMLAGLSPECLVEAAAMAGGRFDWALIDGGHDYDSLVRDLEGTMPVLEDEAYILFHDAHYEHVESGLNDMYAKHVELTDLGMLSKPRVPDGENPGIYWGGIRAARFNRRAA